MDKFREVLEVCDLHDLGYEGDPFTWRNNCQDPSGFIKERLDRAVASDGWCEHFPDFRVINGDPYNSDHKPVIVEMEEDSTWRGRRQGPRPFRFEAMWLAEENCSEVVRNAWEREVKARGGEVADAIKGVAADLLGWNKNSFGKLEKELAATRKALEACRRRASSHENIRLEHELRKKLEKLEGQLDTFWKQRAHINWRQHGDKNSKFFHAQASQKKNQNRIKRLRNEYGVMVEGEGDMEVVITNYFKQLFTSNAGNRT
jgi:hypothetical protein